MATLSTTAQTAVNLGADGNIREDLGNIIFNVTPYQTPFTSGIAKASATADNHEWLTDSYRDSVATNEALEAETTLANVVDTRTRKGNYVQIAKEVATVTKKAELFDKAGISGKEMAYQLMKKGKELHMDVESQTLSLTAKRASSHTVAGRSGSVAAWITTNESVGAGAGAINPQVDGSGVPVPGTLRTFSEATLSGLLDNVWTKSGDFGNVCIMADAARVSSIRNNLADGDAFTDSVQSDPKTGEVYNRVGVYVSQFGPVKVVPNKHMPANQIYVLDMSSWGLAFGGGKMIHSTDIATQTSAEKKLLECYYTLEARSEESNAGYYAVT